MGVNNKQKYCTEIRIDFILKENIPINLEKNT